MKKAKLKRRLASAKADHIETLKAFEKEVERRKEEDDMLHEFNRAAVAAVKKERATLSSFIHEELKRISAGLANIATLLEGEPHTVTLRPTRETNGASLEPSGTLSDG